VAQPASVAATLTTAGNAAPAAPLARTGEGTGASAALALTLILVGTVLRRTGRSPARQPSG
jgi:hypothetical protein